MGDSGLGERCAAIRQEVAKAEKEKLVVETDRNQSSNILQQGMIYFCTYESLMISLMSAYNL